MKICVKCQFITKKGVQVGPQQMSMGYFCTHTNCCEPVTGDPLPANVARSADFCGLKGIYFKEKEAEVKKEGSVIQMPTLTKNLPRKYESFAPRLRNKTQKMCVIKALLNRLFEE